MKFFVYFLSILGLAIMLNASEGPSPASTMVTLVSKDGKEFKVPVQTARELEFYGEFLQDYGSVQLDISSEVLAEIAQLMQMLYQHRDLTREQLIKKADAEIPIADTYAFATAVRFLGFWPGIDLISEKYERSNDYSFPKDEYEYYMKLIQELDSHVYEKLKKCESTIGKQCLEVAVDPNSEGVIENDTTQDPIIAINPALKLWDDNSRKDALSLDIDLFKSYQPTTADERIYILEIIKELAPDLYGLLVAGDPTGLKHVKRWATSEFNARVYSSHDGLPKIEVTSDLLKLPKGELRFLLAHELSHYVLKHLDKDRAPSLNKILILQEQAAAMTKRRLARRIKKWGTIKKVPKVMGQLPFESTFRKAFSRVIESEADRLAVVGFGVSIDDAIAFEKRIGEEGRLLSTPEKETFKSTHPLSPARIKQLEDLRAEVELNKARGIKPKPIDWKALVDFYKG